MSAELVLAAIAAADLCLQYGKRLMDAYQAFKAAEESLRSKLLMIEAIWMRTVKQVDFVKRVANVLEEEHCRIHFEIFEQLKSKLMIAVLKIESVVNKGGIRRLKYLTVRESIDEMIAQLEQWQRLFDPTWYLMLRIDNKLIDMELSRETGLAGNLSLLGLSEPMSSSTTLVSAGKFRSALSGCADSEVHISLPERGLDWDSAVPIKHSTTEIIQRTGSDKEFVVDTIACHSDVDISSLRADTEFLAKKLNKVNPDTFGLLACHGIIKRRQTNQRQLSSISLAFSMPTDLKHPSSLRDLLLQGSRHSLTRVLDIARQLASAVSSVHTCGFVHKNIRPETVLVFPDPISGSVLGSTYLLGFDSFRSVNFHTLRKGDSAWERNLYRHPSRQGLNAQEKYIMQHDVYSLGVCLLELGTWDSFVQYQNDREENNETTAQVKAPSDHLGLKEQDFESEIDITSGTSVKSKEHLVILAKSRLPVLMGDKYTAVVVTCLTCLDEGNDGFGDEGDMLDEDGIMIGVRYIELVLRKLNEVSF